METWESLSARPAFSTAATESPPPTMVVAPLAVSSASVVAMAEVPGGGGGGGWVSGCESKRGEYRAQAHGSRPRKLTD